MNNTGVKYAYVVASPQSRPMVERIYDASLFTLVHASVVERGDLADTRRYLFLLR
jgi:hypothetical protein